MRAQRDACVLRIGEVVRLHVGCDNRVRPNHPGGGSSRSKRCLAIVSGRILKVICAGTRRNGHAATQKRAAEGSRPRRTGRGEAPGPARRCTVTSLNHAPRIHDISMKPYWLGRGGSRRRADRGRQRCRVRVRTRARAGGWRSV